MEDFGFWEMQEMQRRLQQQYREIWEPLSPRMARNQMLWMMVELGEAADIIKKEGDRRIVEDADTRAHFVEELADALMYYNDIMLCYDISVDELKKTYLEKHQRNMHRWRPCREEEAK